MTRKNKRRGRPPKPNNPPSEELLQKLSGVFDEHRKALLRLSKVFMKSANELNILVDIQESKRTCTEDALWTHGQLAGENLIQEGVKQRDQTKCTQQSIDNEKQSITVIKLVSYIIGLLVEGVALDAGIGPVRSWMSRSLVVEQLHGYIGRLFEKWHIDNNVQHEHAEIHDNKPGLEGTSCDDPEEIEMYSYLVEQFEQERELRDQDKDQHQDHGQRYEHEHEQSLKTARYSTPSPSMSMFETTSPDSTIAPSFHDIENLRTVDSGIGTATDTGNTTPKYSSDLELDSNSDCRRPAWIHVNKDKPIETYKHKQFPSPAGSYNDRVYRSAHQYIPLETCQSRSREPARLSDVTSEDISASAMRTYDIGKASVARRRTEVMRVGEMRYSGCD